MTRHQLVFVDPHCWGKRVAQSADFHTYRGVWLTSQIGPSGPAPLLRYQRRSRSPTDVVSGARRSASSIATRSRSPSPSIGRHCRLTPVSSERARASGGWWTVVDQRAWTEGHTQGRVLLLAKVGRSLEFVGQLSWGVGWECSIERNREPGRAALCLAVLMCMWRRAGKVEGMWPRHCGRPIALTLLAPRPCTLLLRRLAVPPHAPPCAPLL